MYCVYVIALTGSCPLTQKWQHPVSYQPSVAVSLLGGRNYSILQLGIKAGFCMIMSILNSYWFFMESNGEKLLNNSHKCKPSKDCEIPVEFVGPKGQWLFSRMNYGMCIRALWRKDGRLQWSTAFHLWYKARFQQQVKSF